MAGLIETKKWALQLGLCAALAGSVGCALEPEPATEDSRASVSVGGKTLWLRTTDEGWPGDDEVEDTVWITRDDSSWGGISDGTQVTMSGTRYAFPEWTRSWGNVDVIELEADLGFWRGISTDLAVALFHRSAGTRNRWVPVDCGMLPYSERTRRTDLEYYEPEDLTIDLDYREIEAKVMDGNGTEWASFSECGVTESTPEFSVFVFPRYNWGNMRDEYAYTLKAWCDGSACPEYTGDPTDNTSSRSGSGSDRYGSRSGSGSDCRDARAGSNCTDSRSSGDYSDRDRYSGSRDSTRYDWQSATTGSFDIRDDGSACSSVTVDESGDARDVVLTVRGDHDYPRALRFTLGKDRRVMDVYVSGLPSSGDFRITDLAVSGFSGEARGTWKLCVEDTDYRHEDYGEITSWSVAGR